MLISKHITTDNKPEIQSIMTISTAHLTEDTLNKITQNQNSYDTLGIYPKVIKNGALSDVFIGYFIYVLQSTTEKRADELPNDMFDIVEFAIANNCNMICLDQDGPIVPDLKYYYEMNIQY